jgi:hypothetical protein
MQSESARELARAAQAGGNAPPGDARRAPSPTGGSAQQFTQEPSQATTAPSSADLTNLLDVHGHDLSEDVVRHFQFLTSSNDRVVTLFARNARFRNAR